FADRLERALGGAIFFHQPKGPVGNLDAAGMPLVGKREHDKSREADLERGARLPREQLRLMLLALANRIHTGFAEHQRTLPGGRHQMSQVAAVVLLAME